MNVTLHQEERSCWEQAGHAVLSREETMEMIVSDACPDILDIVDTDAVLHLRGRECAEDCVTLSGVVPCSILYRPEGGGRLWQLRAEVPFQFTGEVEGASSVSRCVIRPKIILAETRAINPRKVLIRIGMSFEIDVYRPGMLRCASGIEEGEALFIETRREEQTGSLITLVGEKSFPITDEIQLPGSRPAMEELLRGRCRAFVSESRLTGGKLLVKGGVAVRVLYLDKNDQLCGADLELPFSQIMDAGGAADTASFQLSVTVTDAVLEQTDPEGRELAADLELLMQLTVWEEQTVPVLTDAYSIRNAGTPEFNVCTLPQLLEQTTRRQSCRELLETPLMAQEVCDVRAFPGQVRLMGEELAAEVRIAALYLDENGKHAAVLRQVQVKCPISMPEGAACYAYCEVSELDAAASTGGIEVRMAVDFHWTLVEQKRISCLSAFSLDTEETLRSEHQPSVVLRQVTGEETLWDIAKAYLTTCEEIRQANGLEKESVEEGRLLLIPKKRF